MSRGGITRFRNGLLVPCIAAALLGGGCARTPATASVAVPAPVATAPRHLDAADLAAIRTRLHALVDEGQVAGIVTLIRQHGRVVDFDAYGLADTESGAPMRHDAVMAIASMTKPVTGVAMMMLYEQGLWSLDDPVAKHIPGFVDLKVMRGDGTLEPPRHAPTMRELMSHSAGFTYGVFGDSTVDRLYREARPVDPSSTLTAMIGRLARLPLKHQPGTRWEYSVSVDIQGYLVEKLSGMPYEIFMRERIFEPLGMKDTGFAVSGAARTRLAYPHTPGPDGRLVPKLPPAGRDAVAARVPSLPSPGGALFSTASDYARLLQMLSNGGRLDGVRLLKPATVALMRRNMLPEGEFVGPPGSLTGFGLDFAIAPDPSQGGEPWPEGTYYWSGIYGTYFWIDPVNDLIVVGMLQRAWIPGTSLRSTVMARDVARQAIYDALND